MSTKTHKNGNLEITLDRGQVFPDDPGNGTPAMVYLMSGNQVKACATYWCATNEGVLSGCGRNDDYELNDKQIEWLDSLDQKLTEYLYG